MRNYGYFGATCQDWGTQHLAYYIAFRDPEMYVPQPKRVKGILRHTPTHNKTETRKVATATVNGQHEEDPFSSTGKLKKPVWDTWMAQSVKCLTSAQVTISQFVSSSPVLCSVLIAQSLEPGTCFGFYVSLSLCPSAACTLSLKNK